MGSGKGQSRRVQMAANKANVNKNPLEGVSIQHNEEKWMGWVKSLDVENVSIIDFYCGDGRTKNNIDITDKERAFIIREMFLDAVNIGALSFSPKISPQDFNFWWQERNGNIATLVMEYAPKGAESVERQAVFNDLYLKRSRKMGRYLDTNDIFWIFCNRIVLD